MTANCNKPVTPQKKLWLRSALGVAVRIGLLTTPVWALSLMSVDAATIFFSGFESGFSEWRWKEICCDYSAQVVSSPVKAGNKALKITYKKTDYTVRGDKRSELADSPIPAGSERWYGVSIYVPTTFTTTQDGFIITQFHDWSDPGRPKSRHFIL